jgi:hypothetical protein
LWQRPNDNIILIYWTSRIFWYNILPSVELSYGIACTIGIEYGLVMVSSFTRAYKVAMSQGYSGDINTYLKLSGKSESPWLYTWSVKKYICIFSGLWISSFLFGSFVGPTLSGFVVEAIDFRSAALTFVPVYSVFVFFVNLVIQCKEKPNKDRIYRASLMNTKRIFTDLQTTVGTVLKAK